MPNLLDKPAVLAPHDAPMSDAQMSNPARIRAVLAGSAGNLIEWYDFYIYAFTSLYFAPAFFPASSAVAQVMATSGIFAAGFVMRPIGAWFFGRYADRHGRQRAMVASVLMMGAGALTIAVLPGYAQASVAAPALLLAARMAQGFSTGGQYGAVATYLSEVATARRRGFWSSFQYVTLIGGQLLATLVILALQQVLGDAAMKTYGWRIAFAVGAVGALVILSLRRYMLETLPDSAREAGSLRALFAGSAGAFTIVVALTAGGSLAFYTFTTYMQKYLVLTVGMTKPGATLLMTGVLIVFMIEQPVFGLLSDTIGRRTNILVFSGLATLLTVPILGLLGATHSGSAAFLLVLAGLTINAFYTSVSGVFKAELFPTHVRALGVGLAYGIGNALFGGTAENVALGFKQAGHESGFSWYVTAICAASFVAALRLRDTRATNPLDAPSGTGVNLADR